MINDQRNYALNKKPLLGAIQVQAKGGGDGERDSQCDDARAPADAKTHAGRYRAQPPREHFL